MKKALTIAGSDPSGGAGIQADLRSFMIAGVHGASVITCITAQNTIGVRDIYRLPLQIIESQIDVVVEDLEPKEVKTGMLYDSSVARLAAKKIEEYGLRAVVDPVMFSTSGDPLSRKLVEGLKKYLIPLAFILTPNIREAKEIIGREITDAKNACREIHEMGAENVLIKGGHLDKEAKDLFFDGKSFREFSLPKLNRKAHGSGCTYSALITAFLAKGMDVVAAIEKAKRCEWVMIQHGYKPGKGMDIVNQGGIVHGIPPIESDKMKVWLELQKEMDELLSILTPNIIPEVGSDFAYAMPNATDIRDVCSSGRIMKNGARTKIDFGKSKHVASIILESMKKDSSKRCTINIRYSPKIVELCKKAGFSIGNFDRGKEPPGVSTMEWGTRATIQKLRKVPDVIWDSGGMGKEAMVRIIGESPKDVVEKLKKIVEKKRCSSKKLGN